MQILYDAKKDLLYFRLDDRKQQVINRRVSEDVVLDLAEPPASAWIKVHHRDGQVGYVRLSQIWGI
jgi:hypothetical protein